MANKRSTSKQKRARQNRSQREALAARTAGTPVKRPSRVAPSTAARLEKGPRTTGDAGSTKVDLKKSDGPATTGRQRRPRRARPGDTPVDPASLEGSWVSRVTRVPGGTQVLMAAALTVVVTGMMSFMDFFIAEDQTGDEDAEATLTIFEAFGTGRALATLAIPLVLVGIAVAFSLHRQRRRIWMGTAIVLAVIISTTLISYLFVVGFLGYAVMRSVKVEGPAEPLISSWLARRRASATDGGEADAQGEQPATSSHDATTDA